MREDIDWMLAIILLCFTCGIGTFIYLIIYYSKPEDRCVHCNSIVAAQVPGYQLEPDQVVIPQQVQSQSSQVEQSRAQASQIQTTEPTSSEGKQFCPYCGEKIAGNARFCPGCGAKLS